MASEVLPPPEAPTSATVSPGAIRRSISLSAGRSAPGYVNPTRSNTTSPRARSIVRVPASVSTGSSMNRNTTSAAASARCTWLLTSARCLSGASSISIALMNDTKPPTVVWSARDCTSAIAITVAAATAAASWVIGTIVALATVMRRAKLRSCSLAAANRDFS